MSSKNGSVVLEHGVGIVDEPFDRGEKRTIYAFKPYDVEVQITGTLDLLFHRYNGNDDGRKTPGAKIIDDPETSVWRDDNGHISIPGEYLQAALVRGARYSFDPRNKRASAMTLYKSAVSVSTGFAPVVSVTGEKCAETWDYLDRRGVIVSNSRIMRVRPAFLKGWKAEFRVTVDAPDIIDTDHLYQVIVDTGRFIGLGDFRPMRGKFNVTKFEPIVI